MTAYRPSPRPAFDGPAAIPYAGVTRHVWGDPEAGEVADWIYASTECVHALVFGLAPGAWFRHSPEFRTIFGADELLYVLRGTMVIANPETGEVLRVARGGTAFFRSDTWHHVHAHGNEELRVLELYAPPPSKGLLGRVCAHEALPRAGRLALRRRQPARPAAGHRAGAAHAARAGHRLAALAGGARRPLREHRAPHRGPARAQSRRGVDRPRPRRRRGRLRTRGSPARARIRRGGEQRVRARAPTTPPTFRRASRTSTAATAPPARALFGVAPSYLP